MPTMADLAHKKRVRSGHRESTTKMIRKAELLTKDCIVRALLARMKLILQDKVSVLKHLDSEVTDLVEEDELSMS